MDDDAGLLAAARELYEALAEIREAIRVGEVSSEMLNKADYALAKVNFWS
jgi:hypothetical protein